MGIFEAMLLTVITAATPLVLAAIGELVTERSGVLNLGVEGMMVMGAACAFIATQVTGSPYIGILAGIAAGALFFASVRLSDPDAGCQPGGDGPCFDHSWAWRIQHDRRTLSRAIGHQAAADRLPGPCRISHS